MIDHDKISAELRKPLDPKHVRPAKANGPKGDYVEGWHAIAEANEIFGFMAWSYSTEVKLLDQREATNSKGQPQWQVSYMAICTVCVEHVTRQDVGYGSGFARQIGDAHEGAMKEAVTDALKRALRTFGNRFGLALYDKSRENVRAPFDAAGFAKFFTSNMPKCTTVTAITGAENKYRAELEQLEAEAPETFSKVQDAITKRLAEINPADKLDRELSGAEQYQ